MFDYLISFHYYRNTDLDELAASTGREDLTFFADSGAFSAHTTGTHIDLAEYAGWIERWRHRIHAYAGLDVLFDAEGTMRNTEALRKLGLDPMPVFHLGSPLAVFQRYLTESPYVGVGGMASGTLTMRDPRLWKYLDRLHGLAAAAKVGLHGFGLSSWPVIRRFPWRSIDSSTPGTGYRYGRVHAFDPYTDRFLMWALRDRRAWHRHGWLVREYGMTPEQFHGDNVAIRGALIQIAARSWSRAARSLRSRVHLADTSTGDRGGERKTTWMKMWEDGNRWDTALYLGDPHPTPRVNCERIAAWEQGNTWVYVTDAAMQQAQGDGTRLAAYEQGNRWGGTSAPLRRSGGAAGVVAPPETHTAAQSAAVASGV